jgi:type II secretion system protein G
MKNNRGFTLIELLVVISVISIIVGIVIPRFKGMQIEAHRVKAKAELKTLQTGVESYYINRIPHEYPASTQGLCQAYLDFANPVIVPEPLYDPFATAGTEYVYEASPSGTYYVIFSIAQNETADITGIDDDGYLTGTDVDDIFVTNGLGWD